MDHSFLFVEIQVQSKSTNSENQMEALLRNHVVDILYIRLHDKTAVGLKKMMTVLSTKLQMHKRMKEH